jgi:hypothetical protein
MAVLALTLLACGGCQHLQDNERAFIEGSEKGIEDARKYAINRLKRLSSSDLETIARTRPAISHVDYARVHYRWTNICTVFSTPPPCSAYLVLDQRR